MLRSERMATLPYSGRNLAGLGLVTALCSAIAFATVKTPVWLVMALPTAILCALTGAYAIRSVCPRRPVGLWFERGGVALVVWFAMLWGLFDPKIIAIGGGGEASSSLAALILGGPWSWCLTGVWTFAKGRLLQAEEARARPLEPQAGRVQARLVVGGALVLLPLLTAGAVLFGMGAFSGFFSAACAVTGGVCWILGTPRFASAWRGRVLFGGAQLVTSLVLAPMFTLMAFSLLSLDSELAEREGDPAVFVAAWSLAFALCGLRLVWTRPYEMFFSRSTAR